MSFSVKVVEHSVQDYPELDRRMETPLVTILSRYPRCIHAEFMTHRMFSRNASSSRAIPVERLIQDVLDDPYIPSFWGKNQAGMQATEELDEERAEMARWRWLSAMNDAVAHARHLMDLDGDGSIGCHKQIVNRLLEPFGHITVVWTTTQLSNFLALRVHPAAEPHIRILATMVRDEVAASTPRRLREGEWHLPFVTEEERATLDVEVCKKISPARCARTSYRTHDGRVSTVEEDVALCDRLAGQVPLHASPFEHQATPQILVADGSYAEPWLQGNLRGWVQQRKLMSGECQ